MISIHTGCVRSDIANMLQSALCYHCNQFAIHGSETSIANVVIAGFAIHDMLPGFDCTTADIASSSGLRQHRHGLMSLWTYQLALVLKLPFLAVLAAALKRTSY